MRNFFQMLLITTEIGLTNLAIVIAGQGRTNKELTRLIIGGLVVHPLSFQDPLLKLLLLKMPICVIVMLE